MVFVAFGLPEWAQRAVRHVTDRYGLEPGGAEILAAAVGRALATPSGILKGGPEAPRRLVESLDRVIWATFEENGTLDAASLRHTLGHICDRLPDLWLFCVRD